MKFVSKYYDELKWIAQIFLPALITFYGVVGSACSLPYTDVVLTIATGFDAFLGGILKKSSDDYYAAGPETTPGNE